MTQYVLVVSVGPVQSMIASARKSRDLWSGSGLLSELAKACALSLKQQGAELIFPAIDDVALLQADSELSVGNKIQSVITTQDQDIKEIVNSAKQATQQRFLIEAKSARARIKHQQDIRDDIWQGQVNDYVEVQAAWAIINDAQNYAQAVALASKVLAARKATRDFAQTTANPYESHLMIPKSSLDGARETILKEDKTLKSLTRLQLGLSKSEQLDCIAVVKRLGLVKQAEQFTPFTRVSAHAWIEQIVKDELSI